ncbi:hypothetical protein M409DRAFT_49843 [Zasmidium cellare ATCC 36951]|uniref:Uncharacterized protein n=1 Tax=Zasmidium cellare ATCC 36951 TaxID=1080233 RepID=A0A6A6CY35_ZASCE|nr:uncharacterized protein M409DRAFT_49843 [Zasmidium cellare ATCC 36951]KAF2172094.1 hypothetical protein M409DRAFT_49843 [Zasmidium cellare ATCC 36951]
MQHEHNRVPVTALAFWNQHVILAGEGTLLKAYDADRKTLLATVEIFDGQAIHGVDVAEHEESWAVVWGGSSVCFVEVSSSAKGSIELNAGARFEAHDWILDVGCSVACSDNPRRNVLVTAHNSLQLLPSSGLGEGHIEPLVPGSNCILYCAQIRWLSSSQCLIASGTAFGDVIVWSCVVQDVEGKLSAKHQTHYTFSAHEGSVFGVQISSSALAERLAGRQRLLATCSDDRTIRLWDVSDLSVKSPTLIEQQRQTGFGSTSDNDAYAPPALGKVMGHISRIWHVRFEQDTTTGDVFILSFGEDASNITWAITANAGTFALPYSLQQVGLQRAHNGKNIWSLAIRNHRIVTGGADGTISLQHFSPLRIEQDTSIAERDSTDDNHDIGVFRAYGFVDDAQVLASTDHGSLYLADLAGKDAMYTKVSDPIAGLRGYSVMASISQFAFVAGADGEVWIYRKDSKTLTSVAKTGRKVAGLFVQQMSVNPLKIALLITNMGKKTASLYYIEPNSLQATRKLDVHELCIPTGFVTTSFACAQINEHDFAFFGSRNGTIAIFEITHRGMDNKTLHIVQYPEAHAAETVTKLLTTATRRPGSEVYLVSSGRDGTYAVHEVTLVDSQPQMRTVHQLSLPFGPNIEGLGFNEQDHLLVWGFRSTSFVVFDVQTQQEVMIVECGGAHRIWNFQPRENGSTFVWTKASKLYHQSQSRLPCEMINPGGHGREIKCTAISPGDVHLIATGAEDTDIKLSIYQNSGFKTLHTLQKQNTGIQHLQWSSNGEHLFSSGGFEELIAWKITKDIPHINIGVICESKHPRSGTSDLRIMNFDVHDLDDQSFHITTAYSDSSLRSWHYKPQAQTWILLAAGDYLTSCLTQVLHLHPPSTTLQTPTTLLTASTDGHITLWHHPNPQPTAVDKLEWTYRHKIHQNAILALHSCNLPDQSRVLITGGDDNAIGITRVQSEGNSCQSLVLPGAHAAAVTGLGVVDVEEGGGGAGVRIWLVSASIDQRVKLWRVDVDVGEEGVEGVDVRLGRGDGEGKRGVGLWGWDGCLEG